MTNLLKLREPNVFCYLFSFLLLVLCWAVYGNTLHRQFMIDDYSIYTESELGGKNILRYFIPEGPTQSVGPGQVQKAAPTYRPLTKMIWTLTYRWFDGHPVGYHVFNIFVFWLTCCALFFFIYAYTRWLFVAVAATVLFCVHPFQGIMMNNLPTILVSVEMMLMLLGMLFYKYAIDYPADRYGWYALSVIFAFLSFLIHETAVAFPIYFVCVLVYGLGYRFRQAVKAAAPYFILSAAYVLFRMKFASLKAGLWDQARFFDLHLDQYLATFAKLTFWYFAKLISPTGVVMIWTTPVLQSGVLFYIVGLLILFGLLFLAFRNSKHNIVRWGIAWLVIGFLPVSMACLFRLSEGLCLESLWLVFPSVGYFLILGYLLDWLWGYHRKLAVITLGGLVLVLSLTSRIYNRIWSDERRYCYYALEAAPAYRSGYFWLGAAFMREGNYTLARQYLPMALSSKVYNRQIYNNLGLMDFEERKLDSAEKNFLLAIQENPAHSLAYDYLGKIYLQRNDIGRATKILSQAVEVNPGDAWARLGLASIKVQAGDLDAALKYYQENLRAVPHQSETLVALLRLYLDRREQERAVTIFNELLQYSRDSGVLGVVGDLLAQHGYTPLALKAFERALLVNPKDKEVYLELGKLLGNLNQFDDAVRVWQEGAALDSQDPRFGALIAQAKALKAQSGK
jgi:tetratricopeptide (TPR) repeat protein